MERTIGITIDCNDLDGMSRFWRDALGYEDGGSQAQYRWLRSPKGAGPSIILQQVPEARSEKNRLHLDIYAEDIDREAVRLIDIGAHRIDTAPIVEVENTWIRLRDPEGNEFCVVQGPSV
jgi:predicted enzyme related to lactoylglutathione lyase